MKRLILPFAALLLGFSTASNAVSTTRYDFAAEGNFDSGAGEAGYLSFNTGTDSVSGMSDGLTVTASDGSSYTNLPYPGYTPTGTGGDGSGNYWAYIDAKWGQDGGLGVCKIADGACAGNSDDNHMQEEFIHMEFDYSVQSIILEITGDHKPIVDNADFWYSIDEGLSWTSINFGVDNPLVEIITLAGLGLFDTLDYTISPESGQMYLSAMTVSSVPVPAAFWLFGTALIGFVGLSRRTNLS